jgi:hypothetical protein
MNRSITVMPILLCILLTSGSAYSAECIKNLAVGQCIHFPNGGIHSATTPDAKQKVTWEILKGDTICLDHLNPDGIPEFLSKNTGQKWPTPTWAVSLVGLSFCSKDGPIELK